MNPNFLEMWKKAQGLWLEGCLKVYGNMLDGFDEMTKIGREVHEKVKKEVEKKLDETK